MANIEKMLAIAEDSRFLSRLQEMLTSQPVWLTQNGPTPLTDYLYLGGNDDAKDIPSLKRRGITHIINCAGRSMDNSALYINEPDIWIYHSLSAEDHDDYDILKHLPDVQMIIKHAKHYGGKVLVHCERGINRSCALCMAHIMLEFKADLMEVFKKIKELRGICVVNSGFQRQLIRFARRNKLLYPAGQNDFL